MNEKHIALTKTFTERVCLLRNFAVPTVLYFKFLLDTYLCLCKVYLLLHEIQLWKLTEIVFFTIPSNLFYS